MTATRRPVWILCLMMTSSLAAQQFGGNPPSLKWKQIDIPTARVIFPVGLDSQAQQVAAIVRQLGSSTVSTIGGRTRKINIVLQNQTIIPNGYVALAPFRSEFLLTPEQNSFDLGSLPWQKTLAIHEYRHVEQYNNFRVGLSGAFYYLFGESGQALANSLAMPNWFWEGDAVFQETLVSSQGRGRLPFFFDGYRSLWAGNKNYSWMQLRNGSLRDYVPDHYPLGYMMVAYGREKYGRDFWERVSHDAAAFRGLFYPFQQAIERYAGVSFRQFRQDALAWFKARSDAAPDPFAQQHRHFVADEEFPQFIGRDSLIYVRSSYKQIPAFVVRDLRTGADTVIRNRSISLDHYFSYRDHTVVYAAYESDPRWGWRDFSVIRVLDPSSGVDVKLTNRTRYFSPDISADGRHIVAVQEAADGSCALHLLDSRTGKLERAIPNPDALFYTYPKFDGAGRIVSAVRNERGQMALASVNTQDGSTNLLTPFTWQTIGYPSVTLSAAHDTIWFTASHEGRDKIFAVTGGQLYQVMLPQKGNPIGQYAFHGDGGQYAWSEFTAVGMTMRTVSAAQWALQPLSAADWDRPLSTQGIDSLDAGPAHLLDGIPAGHYPVKDYPASVHLLNIHSWRPYISDPNYQYSLVSENILNTLQGEVYVNYNRNEQFTQVGADATYGALFPWLDIGYDYIFNRNTQVRSGTLYWNEMNSYVGYSVPLTFTRGRTNTSLQFGTDYVYERQYFTGKYKDSLADRSFSYLRSFVSLSNQVQQAQQQIYPRFAQTLLLTYDRALDMAPAGQQLLASAYLYLPGAAPTHSIVLGGAAQGRDKFNNGGFANGFPFSRGYTVYNLYRMYRLAANYHFPLAYPDWGFGNLVYFLRIRANLFYDYSHVRDFYTDNSIFAADFRSCGTEIFFDTKWWNELPISFGIRYSRLLDPDLGGRDPNQWELILPLNLLSQGYSARPPVAR
ncbi:MAG: hypothetical protein Q8937_11535 [Bacteroidota bacterium]|nr:hypothetical protein [Bacteroidota bacterium]